MSILRRYPLTSFFILANAITWAAVPFGWFFTPGPLLAALIVVGLTQGRAGLRVWGSRLIRWRVGGCGPCWRSRCLWPSRLRPLASTFRWEQARLHIDSGSARLGYHPFSVTWPVISSIEEVEPEPEQQARASGGASSRRLRPPFGLREPRPWRPRTAMADSPQSPSPHSPWPHRCTRRAPAVST
jgi:hypothetical protein